MPGFLMGLLQFGWLGVNVFFSAQLLSGPTGLPSQLIIIIWGLLAAFVGLKGIQYVAKVATFLPLIPFAILIIMVLKTSGHLGGFDADKLVEASKAGAEGSALGIFGVIALCITYVVGFFATAGAAGADFGMNNTDSKNVQKGGLVGINGGALTTAILAAASLVGILPVVWPEQQG
jgi:cytosine permease